jgi:hypothetical protein
MSTPADKPPADKPPADKPPADKPPADAASPDVASNAKNTWAHGIMARLASMYQSPSDDWDEPFDMPQTFLSTKEEPVEIFTSSSRCGGFTLCWGAIYNADELSKWFPELDLSDETDDNADEVDAADNADDADEVDAADNDGNDDADTEDDTNTDTESAKLDIRDFENRDHVIRVLRKRMNLPDWVEIYALPCCWPMQTKLDVFIGFTIRSFRWVRRREHDVDPNDYEVTCYIRYTYEQMSSWKKCLFLENYESISHWANPLLERYGARIEEVDRFLGAAPGTFVMLPSDCASCS